MPPGPTSPQVPPGRCPRPLPPSRRAPRQSTALPLCMATRSPVCHPGTLPRHREEGSQAMGPGGRGSLARVKDRKAVQCARLRQRRECRRTGSGPAGGTSGGTHWTQANQYDGDFPRRPCPVMANGQGTAEGPGETGCRQADSGVARAAGAGTGVRRCRWTPHTLPGCRGTDAL